MFYCFQSQSDLPPEKGFSLDGSFQADACLFGQEPLNTITPYLHLDSTPFVACIKLIVTSI